MDVSDYLPMFLAEGREHLQNLNLALVRVEHDPREPETANEIFRIAHSLKGMSATMGFARMASLTHEMESVLELLRADAGGLPKPALDVLFACLDQLEQMTGEIEARGTESSDPAPLVARLRLLTGSNDTAAGDGVAARGAGPSVEVTDALTAQGLAVLRVTFDVAADADMPSVRMFIAVRALEAHGDVMQAQPAIAAIERGEVEVGAGVEVWISSADERDAVLATLMALDGLTSVTVSPYDPRAQVAEGAVTRADPSGRPPSTQAPAPTSKHHTVRVDAERLDALMHLVGEMVVQRTHLDALARSSGDPELQSAIGGLSRVAQNLQTMVMQVRMMPIESVFVRFPRMVRDLSSSLGKEIDLRIEGGETEIDRTVIDALGDPLVHLVRNAIDHGFERPDERIAAGKPATGTLTLRAAHAGGAVVLTVTDDGRGVDVGRIGAIAVERGLLDSGAVAELSTADAIELLFHAGFSTVSVATDVSGRGVGLDAVRSLVRSLGGEAVMTSEPGLGSCATVRLPLTLAIMPALVVHLGADPFALPLDRVQQTLRVADFAVREIAGEYAISLRDRILPLFDLGAVLGHPALVPADAHAVVIRSRGRDIGLLVNDLIGQQELVIRPLPPVTAGDRPAVTGGAVLGDGRIALIVDCDELANAALGAAA